jgi:hypothetical protein
MFILFSLAFTLFIIYLYVRTKDQSVTKAVPAYVPQSRIPKKKPQKLPGIVPPYYF